MVREYSNLRENSYKKALQKKLHDAYACSDKKKEGLPFACGPMPVQASRQQNMMAAPGFQKRKTAAATMRRSPPPGPSQACSLPALAVMHSELGESTWY